MIKKYRLKKWYPSLPKDWKEGMEVGQGDRGDMSWYSPCNGKYSDKLRLSIEEVVSNPKFWQEVVEKDYEILSFKYTNGSIYSKLKGLFYAIPKKAYTEEFLLGMQDMVIYSVKRLSDGEVFTVEDNVVFLAESPHLNYSSRIKSFTVRQNTVDVRNFGCLVGSLKNIKHPEEVLFTTEDGVDIFENDRFYKVSNKYILQSRYEGVSNGKELNYDYFTHKHLPTYDRGNYKYFSTKEAAKEYIIYNKPCLSAKDVIGYLEKMSFGVNFADSEFRELVESKL